MQILELRAENFARLVAVEIRPNGALVPISGKNRQGKTTVLKAIWTLIQGKSAAPAVPIREGAEECTLYGDFGSYKVTRTITRDSDMPKGQQERWTLKIIAADGKRITQSPQQVLNGWLATLTLDPLEFARMEPKDQFDKLRALVPGFDFDAKARERQKLYDERTDVNRQVARYNTQADTIMLPPGPEPKTVDVSEKIAELAAAAETNRKVDALITQANNARRDIDQKRDEAETLRARAASLEKAADAAEKALDAQPAIPDHVDTEALRREIEKAQASAAVIAKHQKRRELLQQAKESEAESERLTTAIQALDAERENAIAKAKLPVKGLSLGDGMVLLNGIPLSDASTMEKIMTGAALGMALNPELKVMTIDEASELDSEAMTRLREMAERMGFSVWFTKVDESGEIGFVIEDGTVANIGEMPA